MCFGTCPVFEIKTDLYGNAQYIAGKYSKKQGTFQCKINKKELTDIVELINYIAIKKLENNYTVNWTDYPTCVIRVKFTDGTVKEINDYGELGTFGLRELYKRFFKLRGNQNWVANE
jgi:hypothetical protein